MTLLWVTPREWIADEAITKEKLNEISDSLNYLYSPSRGLATVRNGSNVTITSTTAVDLDAAAYALSVELTGLRDVYVELRGAAQNNTLASVNSFDVYIDSTTYLSSLTGTPLTFGATAFVQYVASNRVMVNVRYLIPRGTLAAGVHTFKPRAFVSAGTLTWIEANGLTQFEVGEI